MLEALAGTAFATAEACDQEARVIPAVLEDARQGERCGQPTMLTETS